jgi:hypothetical protein
VRLREKRAVLERALAGRCGPHQLCLLVEQLAHLDYREAAIERVEVERRAPCPLNAAVEWLSGKGRSTDGVAAMQRLLRRAGAEARTGAARGRGRRAG